MKNRRRETVGARGLAYLHHPLRAAAAEKHIAASLELLREIQRTGDIFFPKRWMDATLSGHQSASAARMVSDFLAALPPDYPERLRRIILSSADDLFRAPDPGTVTAGVCRDALVIAPAAGRACATALRTTECRRRR